MLSVKSQKDIYCILRLVLISLHSFCQDDMIDDVDAFVKVADILKERGAYKVIVVSTHGVLSSDAPRLIEDSSIDEVGNFLFCKLILDRRGIPLLTILLSDDFSFVSIYPCFCTCVCYLCMDYD